MAWEIKQMTLDVDGIGRYEIAWQPGTGGFSAMLHIRRQFENLPGCFAPATIAIDDRDLEGNSVDWDSLEDAKAAVSCHITLCKELNHWKAAEEVWRELRKEAQAEEAANHWASVDYLGGGL